MRRGLMLLCPLLAALALAGCSQASQIENQGYVILLGVDAAQGGGIEITAQIPKAEKASSDGTGGGEDSYMNASATGQSYAQALEALQIIVPRELNLTQTKLVVISRALAEEARFPKVMTSMYETYRIDTAAWFVISEGSAKEFVAAQKPVIGTRVSNAIAATLENAVHQGCVPAATFAEAYLDMVSVYSDPVAIYALAKPGQGGGSGGEMGGEGKNDVPAAVINGAQTAGELTAESDSGTVYLGTALMRQGTMAGLLTGGETLCLNLLHGAVTQFSMSVDGRDAQLTPAAAPAVRVDIGSDPVRIVATLTMTMADTTDAPDISRVKAALEENLTALQNKCAALKVEPFGFARRAAANFLTIPAWQAFDWREKFARAEAEYRVNIQLIDT